MAVSSAPSRAEPELRSFYPRWPARGFEPARAWVDYDPAADELLVYFEQPTGSVSVPIDTPERDYVYVLVDEESEAVVGIQVDAMRAWVGAAHPRWVPLADDGAPVAARRAAVAALVAEAAGLFALYGAGRAEVVDSASPTDTNVDHP
jgi:hypothetical protein